MVRAKELEPKVMETFDVAVDLRFPFKEQTSSHPSSSTEGISTSDLLP